MGQFAHVFVFLNQLLDFCLGQKWEFTIGNIVPWFFFLMMVFMSGDGWVWIIKVARVGIIGSSDEKIKTERNV